MTISCVFIVEFNIRYVFIVVLCLFNYSPSKYESGQLCALRVACVFQSCII